MHRAVGWVALATVLVGCSDEVARAPSPSGVADAVLVETNGGATTSFGYEVYVVPSGGSWRWSDRLAHLYGAYRNRSAYGANLRWASPDVLVIEYLGARSAHLEEPSITIGDQIVRLELRADVEDPSAPPGGMLYNLQGRP